MQPSLTSQTHALPQERLVRLHAALHTPHLVGLEPPLHDCIYKVKIIVAYVVTLICKQNLLMT